MTAFFSRVRLRPVQAYPGTANAMSQLYSLHQSLWKLFPEDESAKRDFLFRAQDGEPSRTCFVVSARAPRMDDAVWEVTSKPYDPQIVQGQRLAFSLRANPVVVREDKFGKKMRHDVVLDAHKLAGGGSERPIEEAGRKWLQDRAEDRGFKVEALRVEGYQQHRLLKRGQRPIQFSTLDFDGVLTVTDPEKLRHTLFAGFGKSKGFGCGLLLVRNV